MAEGTYEYECMRAELLGLQTPDEKEFETNKVAKIEVMEDEMDTINLEDTEIKNEQYSRMGGKLNELNSILKNTQKKINNFKTYGFVTTAVTSLFKFKKDSNEDNTLSTVGTTSNKENASQGEKLSDNCNISNDKSSEISMNSISTASKTSGKKGDLANALDKQTDVLDSLLDKSENAEYSMMHQRKEMKRFLK